MKKFISFLSCSLIALSISLGACAQSTINDESPGIELSSQFNAFDQGVVGVSCPQVAYDFNTGTTAEANDAFRIPLNGSYREITFAYRPDKQGDVDFSKLDLPYIFYDQIPLNESLRPLIPQYYHEYGDIQGGQVVCMYMVPISRKEAKRLMKQLHPQGKSDPGKRPPGDHYLARL